MPDALNDLTFNDLMHQWTLDDIRKFVENYWCAVPSERWTSVEHFVYEGFTPERSWELFIQGATTGTEYRFTHMGKTHVKQIKPELMVGNPQGVIDHVVTWVDSKLKRIKG